MNARRRRQILDRVRGSGFVSYQEIAWEFDVSVPTARRDVEALAEAGFVNKHRGGVSSTREVEHVSHPADSRAEDAISWSAAILAKPSMTIGIVGGFVAAAVARHLTSVPNLTIVTNSLAVLEAIASRPLGAATPSVVMLPGSIDREGSVVGSISVQALRDLYPDMTYLSVQGFDPLDMIFSERLDAAIVARAFVSSSKKIVALAPSSRWADRSQTVVAALPDLHIVVSDPGLSAADRLLVAEAGVVLTIAGDRPGARRVSGHTRVARSA